MIKMTKEASPKSTRPGMVLGLQPDIVFFRSLALFLSNILENITCGTQVLVISEQN